MIILPRRSHTKMKSDEISKNLNLLQDLVSFSNQLKYMHKYTINRFSTAITDDMIFTIIRNVIEMNLRRHSPVDGLLECKSVTDIAEYITRFVHSVKDEYNEHNTNYAVRYTKANKASFNTGVFALLRRTLSNKTWGKVNYHFNLYVATDNSAIPTDDWIEVDENGVWDLIFSKMMNEIALYVRNKQFILREIDRILGNMMRNTFHENIRFVQNHTKTMAEIREHWSKSPSTKDRLRLELAEKIVEETK